MSLTTNTAQNTAHVTKTQPILTSSTPKWILRALYWEDVDAGIYRVNQVSDSIGVITDHKETDHVRGDSSNYNDNPTEHTLHPLQTIVKIPVRVMDLYNNPHNQLKEQIRLAIENLKELQELHLFTSETFGLLSVATKISNNNTLPTPDSLDSMMTSVWNQPMFYIMHPECFKKFSSECNKLGLNLETTNKFGCVFTTWRGVTILLSDKIPIDNNTTSILLLRTGKSNNGVIGLTQKISDNPTGSNISIHYKGVSDNAMVEYIITLYYGVAVLSPDAIVCLTNVSC